MNELLLIVSLLIEFFAVVVAYRLFGKTGLYAMIVFCAVAANIEVSLLVSAFGIEQTLGNVLFASSFLITDILSENEGKQEAQRAVNLGVFTSVLFIIVSQSWLLYNPSVNDVVMPGFKIVFSQTGRVLLSSFVVYAVTQRFDVWLYHKLWSFTETKSGDKTRFMWLRNNAATLTSQLLNTVLFNVGAFLGLYPIKTVVTICVSSYLVFIVTSLADTPFLYIARKMKNKNKIPE